MKKKVKHIEESRKSFEIEVPPADVKKRLGEFYDKIAKVATVPGFRVGKAPRDLLERHYSERATKEVVEDMIAHSYHQALEEEGFIPLGFPQISDVKLDEQRSLFFKAEFNIRPKIELKNYKGLKVTKKKVAIKEEDVEKSLKSLQEASAKFKNAQDRPVQIGDYIICDSEVLVDGKPIAKKRQNIWMPIEESSYIPGLSAKLVGANIGDEKEIETTLPADFNNKEYANKKAVFKIAVKEIKEKALSEINDEFAKDLGYNNLSELRESVSKLMENQAENQLRQEMEGQLLEKILENSNFTVPTSLVDRQAEYLFEEEKKRFLKQGLKEEDIDSKKKEILDRYKPLATKQVRTMFILDEIAGNEKIDVTSQELDEALEEIARRANQPREKVERYYKENDLISNLRTDIRNNKVLGFLIREAKVEEGQ